MKKFETLEHKADLKIRAFGKTKEELFLNMLFGMQESMKPEAQRAEERVKREIKIRTLRSAQEPCFHSRRIKIKSLDLSSLLVDFLNEVLYLTQVNKEAYFEARFKKFSDTEIEGELIGQKVERFGEDIKAATHHSLDIHQREDGIWEATVLFDI